MDLVSLAACGTNTVVHARIRDLRDDPLALLARVEEGERVTIIAHGRPVAELVPLPSRRQWMGRDELLERLQTRRADAGLLTDLAALAPGTTDDVPID